MLQRARTGDDGVLPELRAFLDSRPDLWKHYGDLAIHAQQAWIEKIGGADLWVKECLHREVARLKHELVGTSPSPLEGLLADRIVACWLQVYHADLLAAQAMGSSLKLVDFLGKRQARTHRCLVSSIGALAMVRRLMLPFTGGIQGSRSPVEDGGPASNQPEHLIGPNGRPCLRLVVPGGNPATRSDNTDTDRQRAAGSVDT
jgi:hypothetical protein